MIRNYFTIALRSLLKHKVYSSLNIAGLAIGLATTLLALLWVKDELSYDRFHDNHKRLYSVMLHLAPPATGISTQQTVPIPIAGALKREVQGVAGASLCSFERRVLISNGEQTTEEQGYNTDTEFLKIFSFPLVKGNAATALTEPNSIVITQKLAAKYFKAGEPLGKMLRIDHQTDVKVVGVLADVPANSSLQFDYLMPYQQADIQQGSWNNNNEQVFVLLDEKAASADNPAAPVNEQLKRLVRKYMPDRHDRYYSLFAQTDWHLRRDWKNGHYGGGGRITYVQLFGLVGLFVLLIACINFINLSTAKATGRAKEVGVRKVVGATKTSLVGQFLSESLVLTLVAGGLALGLLLGVLPFFNELIDKQLTIDWANPLYSLSYASLLVLTSLLAGIYPAFVLSGFQPVKVLKGLRHRMTVGSARLRQVLVVTQFALSILLIVGTIIVYQQISFIRSLNIGYNKDNLVIFSCGGLNDHRLERAKAALGTVPGVLGITAANTDFRGARWRTFPSWAGKPTDKQVLCSVVVGDYEMISTLGLHLQAGRTFSRSFGRDTANFMINEEAARRMNLKQPLGHELDLEGSKGTIIGVVKDFHLTSVHSPIEPVVILCNPHNTFLFLTRIDGRDVPQTLTKLESVYKSLTPDIPFRYQFADVAYANLYRGELQIGALANWFTVLAIFISCLGLLGLASFTVERRTKEIGVRKVLGASVNSIFGLIAKEFVGLVLIALAFATAPAWYLMNQWLDKFAYKIDIEWWVFAGAGLIAIGIALVTVSFQSVKAALMDPVKSLRTE